MLCLPHARGGLLCRVHAGQRHERMLQDTQHKPEPNADDLDRAVERLERERQNEEPLDQGERFICGAHGGGIGRLDSDKNVLSRAEYAADALPETLAAPEHAALLVTAMQSVDGTTERTLCTQDDLFSRAYVPSTLSGLLRVVDVSLDWGENGT